MFGQKKDNHQVDIEIFTIYDSKTKSYREPTWAINHHACIREILTTFKKPEQQQNNQFYTNAEDFSLFRIGTFDKKTGVMKTCEPIEHIVNMHDLRALVQPTTPNPGAENFPPQFGDN